MNLIHLTKLFFATAITVLLATYAQQKKQGAEPEEMKFETLYRYSSLLQ